MLPVMPENRPSERTLPRMDIPDEDDVLPMDCEAVALADECPMPLSGKGMGGVDGEPGSKQVRHPPPLTDPEPSSHV